MSVQLPIFGTPEPGDLDAIRAAKAELGLSFLVKPVDAAHAPRNLRVLALRERPSWIADSALVLDVTETSELKAALAYVLRQSNDYHRAVTAEQSVLPMLRSVFGPNVREILDDPEPEPEPPAEPEAYEPTEQWLTAAQFFAA